MSSRWWLVAACGLCMVGAARAQSLKDGERALQDAVVGKQLYLRGFSADDVVRWRWDGGTLAEEPPTARMLGVFVPTSVTVKGDTVEIRGERREFLKRKDGTLAISPSKDAVRMEADMRGADSSVMPRLADLLFYPDSTSAIAALPPRYQTVLPRVAGEGLSFPKPVAGAKACDCAAPCAKDSPHVMRTGVKPPRVVYQVDPQFSDAARRTKFSGAVRVGLNVNASGAPEDLWVVVAAGLGLDEAATRAVSQYRFSPATCHGVPIAVPLYIDVSFRIF